MPRSLRVLAILASLLVLLGAAPAAFAGGPTREVVDLNDPQIDIDETAWATGWCGFPVVAQVSGRIQVKVFPEGRRATQELDIYGIRVWYRNPANGKTAYLRDIGPDRFFVRDGHPYVAVTGRSSNGSGVIGVVVIDMVTGDVVHSAGNDVGVFNDWFCGAIAG